MRYVSKGYELFWIVLNFAIELCVNNFKDLVWLMRISGIELVLSELSIMFFCFCEWIAGIYVQRCSRDLDISWILLLRVRVFFMIWILRVINWFRSGFSQWVSGFRYSIMFMVDCNFCATWRITRIVNLRLSYAIDYILLFIVICTNDIVLLFLHD